MPTRLFARAALPTAAALISLAAAGCARLSVIPRDPVTRAEPTEVRVADGVVYRTFSATDPIARGTDVWLVDIDLSRPGVEVRAAAHGLRRKDQPAFGDARTAAEWCAGTGAVAAVNGGYFGGGSDERKEIVGLLVQRCAVVSGAPVRRGARGPYVRSAFGVSPGGVPTICWASGKRGGAGLRRHVEPTGTSQSTAWRPASAVGCGPRLVVDGENCVTDREERLVSKGRLSRTFVGYSTQRGRPVHLILAVGQRMEYSDAAAFVQAYFQRQHSTECAEAMCLDGGGSSQLAFIKGGAAHMPVSSLVTTPTAVVVLARP